MWEGGQVVEVQDNEKPPHHFELISGDPVAGEKEVVDPMAPKSGESATFSEIIKSQSQIPLVGFASSLKEENPGAKTPRKPKKT